MDKSINDGNERKNIRKVVDFLAFLKKIIISLSFFFFSFFFIDINKILTKKEKKICSFHFFKKFC